MELEIVPEHSIKCPNTWELALGMNLNMCINVFTHHFERIKNIKLLYDAKEPLTTDINIILSDDALRLEFDAQTQVLKVITIYDLTKVDIKYNGQIICEASNPCLGLIQDIIGATRPIVYDHIQRHFVLGFRGLAFYFPSEPNVRPNSMMLATGLSLFSGSNYQAPKLPILPVSYFFNHCYPESVEILRDGTNTLGLKIKMMMEVDARKYRIKTPSQGAFSKSNSESIGTREVERTIFFGESEESILSKLGNPNKIFYKEDDKMQIHSPSHRRKHHVSDYFYNYFTFGLDFLFDSKGFFVKKIILHTNIPGSHDFGSYHHCPFSLILSPESTTSDKSLSLTSWTKWSEAKELLKDINEKFIVVPSKCYFNFDANFRDTVMYGYQDMIFEVMENDHITTLTLFHSGPIPTI